MSCPLAIAWPCPRWVEVIRSSGRRAAIAPIATASWPDAQMHRAVHFAERVLLKGRFLEKPREVHLVEHVCEARREAARASYLTWGSETMACRMASVSPILT